MARPETPRSRFVALDGWRGVCALLVVVFHVPALGHFHDMPFVRNSYLFVDFFFVLSGFVISHAYAAGVTTRTDLARFVVRRFGRVWPLHAVMLGCFVAYELLKLSLRVGLGVTSFEAPFQGPTSVAALAANVVLVHALGIFQEPTWNSPSWSISTEFWTYVTFGLVAVASGARLGWAAAVVSAVGCVVVALGAHDFMYTAEYLGLFRCWYGFFFGHLVWRAHRAGVAAPEGAASTAAEVAAVLGVAAFVSSAGRGPLTLLAPWVFGFAVLAFAPARGAVGRLMETRPFEKLGELSYSIYMIHMFLLLLAFRAARIAEAVLGTSLRTKYTNPWGATKDVYVFHDAFITDLVLVGFLGVVVLVASFTYRFVERPTTRWFNKRAATIGAPTQAAAT